MDLNVQKLIDEMVRARKRCPECIGWPGVWSESGNNVGETPPVCPDCGWQPVIIRRGPLPSRRSTLFPGSPFRAA